MFHVGVAVGLYRPEFYDLVEDEDGNCTDGMAEMVFVKSQFEKMNSICYVHNL